ncbi:MAG: hypothetical protein HQ526_00415 [Actinobacteria bacterium]|nr:hypothetical protein [Actinomycetota bacterium]
MPLLMTHFYPGGTAEQYAAVLKAVHPDGRLPAGQLVSAAGPTDDGWLISAVWESREALRTFVVDVLEPSLGAVTGGFESAPQEMLADCTLFQTA